MPSDPLLNRAVQTTLPPGSTFKVVTAAAAMQTGDYTASSLVPGGPSYRLPQSTKVVHNEIPNCGTTKIPFTQAMQWSCNTSFAPIAVDVGANGMHRTAEGFGFNQRYLEDSTPPRPSRCTPAAWTRPRPRCPASARARSRRRRSRWRWRRRASATVAS